MILKCLLLPLVPIAAPVAQRILQMGQIFLTSSASKKGSSITYGLSISLGGWLSECLEIEIEAGRLGPVFVPPLGITSYLSPIV